MGRHARLLLIIALVVGASLLIWQAIGGGFFAGSH